MRRFGFKLFIAAAIYAIVLGCGSEALKVKDGVSGDIPTKLTLYSIDFREAEMEESEKPKNDGKERIGAYVVLGKTEIKDPQRRKEIMDSIREAIRNPDEQYKCFYPRHLIRVVEHAGTSEIAICFQCRNYGASGEFATEGLEAISDRPKELLTRFWRKQRSKSFPKIISES